MLTLSNGMSKLVRGASIFAAGGLLFATSIQLASDWKMPLPAFLVLSSPAQAQVLPQPSNTKASAAQIMRGVQQSDALVIRKLAPLAVSQSLITVQVPAALPAPTVIAIADSDPTVTAAGADRAAATSVTSSPTETDPLNQALTLDQELVDEQVSPALLARFNQVISATSTSQPEPVIVPDSVIAVPVADLPESLQAQLPAISYNSHVYSSIAKNRSVRLNNKDLHEGSWLTDDIEVLEILPNEVIMRVGPQSFSMPALADWR